MGSGPSRGADQLLWDWNGRAGQGRAGQGRAGQGRAGQGRAGQGAALYHSMQAIGVQLDMVLADKS